MLAVNCRAYQAALILFDTIKRVANRECTISIPHSTTSTPAPTSVPFYDHLETTNTFNSQLYSDIGTQNTEEKLKNVMNAWFSKDAPPTTGSPTSSVGTAPVIIPVHPQASNHLPSSFSKRTTETNWLHMYPQQPSATFSVSQSFDSTCRSKS